LISLDYPSGALVVSEITKLSPLEPGNERLNLCGVSRIVIRIFSSTTAPILCGALLGGESERAFFAFFTTPPKGHGAGGGGEKLRQDSGTITCQKVEGRHMRNFDRSSSCACPRPSGK